MSNENIGNGNVPNNGPNPSVSGNPNVRAVPEIHIAKGNAKLASSIGIFDLPVMPGIICIGAGKCAKWCFPKKAQQWANVWPARVDNYEASKRSDFVDRMLDSIRKSGLKTFSPHHAGDIFDQDYVNKWAEIARRLPDVRFFCYTKSLNLDLTPLTCLPNFTVIRSFGGRYDHLINKSTDNYSEVVSKVSKKTVTSGEFVCPAITLGRSEAEKFCGNLCNYCVSDRDHKVRVVFLEKKAGRNGNRFAPKGATPLGPPASNEASTDAA